MLDNTLRDGLSLRDLAQKVNAQAALKHDIVADTRDIEIIPPKSEAASLHLSVKNQSAYALTPIAEQQIAERVGIPIKYYRRMRSDAPQLLGSNLSHWFQEQPQRRMLRTHGNTARAFLSDKYRRLDNEQLLEQVLPTLFDTAPDMQVVSSQVTDKRLYLKIISPKLTTEVRLGDPVQFGVLITNSEIGLGALKVVPFTYRLVCLNGMVREKHGMRKTHVGKHVEDDLNIYSDEAMQADDHAFWLKVRDVLKQLLSVEAMNLFAQEMRQAMSIELGKPAKAIEVLSQKFTLNKAEQEGVLAHLIKGADLSQWGLANAITRTAQDLDDYDRMTEFESFGYKVLTNPGLPKALEG